MDEHDEKAHRQQRAGEPDPADAEARREQCAEPRAGGEHADHAEVRQRLVQHLAVMRVEVDILIIVIATYYIIRELHVLLKVSWQRLCVPCSLIHLSIWQYWKI